MTRLIDSVTRARVWLAVLGLASLASSAVWGDYVPMPVLWLVTMYAVEVAASRKMAVVMVVNTLMGWTLVGNPASAVRRMNALLRKKSWTVPGLASEDLPRSNDIQAIRRRVPFQPCHMGLHNLSQKKIW